MAINQASVPIIADIIKELFNHIHIPPLTNLAPYLGAIEQGSQFCLDDEGYDKWYTKLFNTLFSISSIAEVWSEDAIRREISSLLVKLATIKNQTTQKDSPPEFDRLSTSFIEKIDISFNEIESFVPIIGLAVDQPLGIGDITFWPLEMKKKELGDRIHSNSLDDLSSFKDSIASTTIRAEPQRAVEILRNRAESSLNVIRFICSLIWQNEPLRYIYVAGRDPRRTTYAFAMDHNGAFLQMSNTTRNPLPVRFDVQTLQYAHFWGLGHLQSLLKTEQISPLAKSMFTAIEWFGDAIQDFSPMYSFVKHCISLEAAVKRKDEDAGSSLPKRISKLIEPFDMARQKRLKKTITTIFKERNSIFHEGKPEYESIEYLEWTSRHVARNTIHRLKELIVTKHIETKDDLVRYINHTIK